MSLKEGSVLFARIDYKIGDSQETEQDAIDSMEYLQKIARERYLAAGVFGNMELGTMDGAMVLFEAKNLAEAQKIANDDPIIQRGYYRCDVYQWNVMLLSKNAG